MFKKALYLLVLCVCTCGFAKEKRQGLIEYIQEVPYMNKAIYEELKGKYEKFFGEISDLEFLQMFKGLKNIDLEGLPFTEDDLSLLVP